MSNEKSTVMHLQYSGIVNLHVENGKNALFNFNVTSHHC